ncbi:MAG: aminotransferase class V-fold PLP-dependent enzyme [Bdellovibrionales bacterium]
MWSSAELTQLFPQLKSMAESGITYLDSAATSLKLKASVEAQYDFDLHHTANVHRGAHRLSGAATQAYENSRISAAKYLNCSPEQIVFTKGTTDSINLIANHFSQTLTTGDCILLTEMEHHANLLPWQQVSKATGAKLLFASVDATGELNLEEIEDLLGNNNVKVLSLCHISNTTGTLNPIDAISKLCIKQSVSLVVDGAQAVTALKPDLKSLNTDFYTFSAHKIFGPFGVGILFIKDVSKIHLYQQGGGIVTSVESTHADFVKGPQKFETGTPNISGVIALKEVFKFLGSLDFSKVQHEERELLNYTFDELSKIEGFEPVGTSNSRVNILSFNFKGVHPNDLCELLDEQGIALRAGHHCTQPLLKKMGLAGCARASFSIYNSKDDADKLVKAIKKSLEVLR